MIYVAHKDFEAPKAFLMPTFTMLLDTSSNDKTYVIQSTSINDWAFYSTLRSDEEASFLPIFILTIDRGLLWFPLYSDGLRIQFDSYDGTMGFCLHLLRLPPLGVQMGA